MFPKTAWGHERRFRDFRGTSAYPPRLAVKADIPDRQVCAISGHRRDVQMAYLVLANFLRPWG